MNHTGRVGFQKAGGESTGKALMKERRSDAVGRGIDVLGSGKIASQAISKRLRVLFSQEDLATICGADNNSDISVEEMGNNGDGRAFEAPELIPSDELPAYMNAIQAGFSEAVPDSPERKPGRQ